MKVLENINQNYGNDIARLISQGLDEKWAIGRLFLTLQYKTSWHNIPDID